MNQYAETENGSVHEVFAYQSVSYHYLGDTRLARVSSSAAGVYELGYDALGRCVRRTSNGVSTYYIYDGERPIIEFNAVGTITARNTYGIGMDEVLARDSGTPLYYHQDRLGNVSAVTNGVGQVVEQYRYDAFGQPEIRGGPVPGNANGALTGTPGNNVTQVNNRFLFTGREWVANYGFYEYRNRAYNPALGRFMSEDPMGMQIAGGKPSPDAKAMIPHGQMPETFSSSEFNFYRYCHNDPVNHSDPTGLYLDTIIDAAFIAYDLYKLSNSDEAHLSENRIALRLDIAAAALPGVTGAGAVFRAGKLAEHAAQAGSAAKKVSEMTAAERRAHFLERGVPAHEIGPSGHPKIHAPEHSSLKEAKDAARADVGKGGTTVKDASPARGDPHFQGETQDGERSRIHHVYPY